MANRIVGELEASFRRSSQRERFFQPDALATIFPFLRDFYKEATVEGPLPASAFMLADFLEENLASEWAATFRTPQAFSEIRSLWRGHWMRKLSQVFPLGWSADYVPATALVWFLHEHGDDFAPSVLATHFALGRELPCLQRTIGDAQGNERRAHSRLVGLSHSPLKYIRPSRIHADDRLLLTDLGRQLALNVIREAANNQAGGRFDG